ncbi:ABC transporter ATP-binding protein [Aliarcobacter skirrowii]|uniref:ABC transporter ATP-binding protein n=1 Tax=Aliarcobacter skirrowii TaxID=28200 RepID=UPI002A35D322|nr:ABC transporter ATP-binding protein [Aliarcobacter skirrowii]MDY0181659.1 ABC transporter ATP-binding protein [Aliarcobacter skirrowii]
MYKLIKELFSLLETHQKRKLITLQVMVLTMAFLELVGIASIGPFMALVGDSDIILTNSTIHSLYELSGVGSTNRFLLLSGSLVLLMLTISSLFSIITTWRLSRFSFDIGIEMADRLYKHYLNRDWLFHANTTSSKLTKQIATETNRLTGGVILPLMQLNSRAVLAFFISISLFIYNPIVATSGLILFAGGYFVIYRIIKTRLGRYGANVSKSHSERYKLMSEGFGGIKDILLLYRKRNFIEKFEQAGIVQARSQAFINAFGQVPKFMMELLAFGSMIALVLFLIKTHNGALNEVLPVLAVYALAGFKLLPALQQIYQSITTIKGHLSAFEVIREDLIASKVGLTNYESKQNLPSISTIKLENVTFTYPNKKKPALNDVSLVIKENSTVGFVGESGSGKSTTVDMLLALIVPDHGRLMIGEVVIDSTNRRAWQKQIGFVPQAIFLSEGTIAENIAFGLSEGEIDMGKVKKAATLAHLNELIVSLDNGLETKVGERGVQLSGGQRQRIGIARALYSDAKVLVFDEATSALDGITEKIIMDAISELSGERTIIIIAHRLKTVANADQIYMFDKGKIVDHGTFDGLIGKNKQFAEMAKRA